MHTWLSWFENCHFHIGELWGLKAVIEFYYGLELNDDAHCRLRLPHGLDARAELRALRARNGGFKLAHMLITQDLIDSATLFTNVNHVTLAIVTLRNTSYRRNTTLCPY